MGPGKPEKYWKSAQLQKETCHNLLYKKCMLTVRRIDFEILGMKEFQSLEFVSVKGYELGRKDVLVTSC